MDRTGVVQVLLVGRRVRLCQPYIFNEIEVMRFLAVLAETCVSSLSCWYEHLAVFV